MVHFHAARLLYSVIQIDFVTTELHLSAPLPHNIVYISKASRMFRVKSARVQVIHSRIILLCYLWTIQHCLHLMCHRNYREACSESSGLPEKSQQSL